MKKIYTVIYKVSRAGIMRNMIITAKNKTELRAELKDNGAIVIAILTDKEIDSIKNDKYAEHKKHYAEYVQQVL